jgi:putative alpha-1,2-mannosidase
VFSALGFYPVCPGTDEYVLGAPLFKKALLHLENGNTVAINAPENSAENKYIHALSVNGAAVTRNYLTHGELLDGATLNATLSHTPNTRRGTKVEDAPYSFSKQP